MHQAHCCQLKLHELYSNMLECALFKSDHRVKFCMCYVPKATLRMLVMAIFWPTGSQ